MIVQIKIEHGKDASGEKKRIMWVTVHTEIEGLNSIATVSDLGDDTPLAKEVDYIVSEMISMKTSQLREKNKRLIAKKRTK